MLISKRKIREEVVLRNAQGSNGMEIFQRT